MTNYDYAFEKTLGHEGGFNEVKGDSGGATNFGVSLRFLEDAYRTKNWVDLNHDGKIDRTDIKLLEKDDVKKIYLEDFWLKNKCDKIDNKYIAAKLFDISVNMGNLQAAKILQRAINQFKIFNLTVDGKIGPATLMAVNKIVPEQLLNAIRKECEAFYTSLVNKRPEYKKFLKGWLNRART